MSSGNFTLPIVIKLYWLHFNPEQFKWNIQYVLLCPLFLSFLSIPMQTLCLTWVVQCSVARHCNEGHLEVRICSCCGPQNPGIAKFYTANAVIHEILCHRQLLPHKAQCFHLLCKRKESIIWNFSVINNSCHHLLNPQYIRFLLDQNIILGNKVSGTLETRSDGICTTHTYVRNELVLGNCMYFLN